MLGTIPEFSQPSAMAKRLGIGLKRVEDIIRFLVKSGILQKKGDRFRATQKLMHLERNSPLISKHHLNWRIKNLSSLDALTEEQLHYTSAVALSHQDFEVVREILVKALSHSIAIIKKSPEEDVAMLSLSWQFL